MKERMSDETADVCEYINTSRCNYLMRVDPTTMQRHFGATYMASYYSLLFCAVASLHWLIFCLSFDMGDIRWKYRDIQRLLVVWPALRFPLFYYMPLFCSMDLIVAVTVVEMATAAAPHGFTARRRSNPYVCRTKIIRFTPQFIMYTLCIVQYT